MTAFAGAIDAILNDANLGRDATYRVAGGGATLLIRVVPLSDPPELAGGAVLAAMTNDGRSFLVRRGDFAAVDPRTGDTVEVEGETWRVRAARQRTPLADVWVLDCQPHYVEEPQEPFVEGDMTIPSTLDVGKLVESDDITVTLELDNGNVVVLRNASIAAGEVDHVLLAPDEDQTVTAAQINTLGTLTWTP